MVSLHDDCSEQRDLSSQLATTKKFLESVIDNVPVCVAAKSIEDGRYILANRAFERFSRLSRDQIVGKRADEIFPASNRVDHRGRGPQRDRGAGRPVRSELAVERGAETRTLASNRVIARNDKDQPEFLIALFDDITEQSRCRGNSKIPRNSSNSWSTTFRSALIVERVSDGRTCLPTAAPRPSSTVAARMPPA